MMALTWIPKIYQQQQQQHCAVGKPEWQIFCIHTNALHTHTHNYCNELANGNRLLFFALHCSSGCRDGGWEYSLLKSYIYIFISERSICQHFSISQIKNRLKDNKCRLPMSFAVVHRHTLMRFQMGIRLVLSQSSSMNHNQRKQTHATVRAPRKMNAEQMDPKKYNRNEFQSIFVSLRNQQGLHWM